MEWTPSAKRIKKKTCPHPHPKYTKKTLHLHCRHQENQRIPKPIEVNLKNRLPTLLKSWITHPAEKSASWNLFFLFLNQNICCGYSIEPSQWDGSFEHPEIFLSWWIRKYSQFYADFGVTSAMITHPAESTGGLKSFSVNPFAVYSSCKTLNFHKIFNTWKLKRKTTCSNWQNKI